MAKVFLIGWSFETVSYFGLDKIASPPPSKSPKILRFLIMRNAIFMGFLGPNPRFCDISGHPKFMWPQKWIFKPLMTIFFWHIFCPIFVLQKYVGKMAWENRFLYLGLPNRFLFSSASGWPKPFLIIWYPAPFLITGGGRVLYFPFGEMKCEERLVWKYPIFSTRPP